MKCICSQKDLQDALLAASKALPGGNTQTPVLRGIYFLTTSNILELHSTDFSTGVVARIPAEIESQGSFLVNGKDVNEMIRSLSGGDIVTLSNEEDSNIVTIKCDATTFSIYTIDSAEDFPRVTTQEYTHSFYIKNKTLKKLILNSIFACADEKEGRPVFQGCSISINGEEITFVATNTHRLIVAKGLLEDAFPEEISLIVPSDALADVLAILNSIRDERGVKIDFSDKHIAFTINNMFVTCRLIDGTFPQHNQVIPESCQTFANISISELRPAINHVAIIAGKTDYNMVIFSFSNEGLELRAESYATGKAVEHLNAEVTGPDVEIAFNLEYVQDFLRNAASTDILQIGMNDKLSPTESRLADDDSMIYIVTPIRV